MSRFRKPEISKDRTLLAALFCAGFAAFLFYIGVREEAQIKILYFILGGMLCVLTLSKTIIYSLLIYEKQIKKHIDIPVCNAPKKN